MPIFPREGRVAELVRSKARRIYVLSKAFRFDMCARKNPIEFRKTKKNELYASKTQLNEEKQWNVQRCAAKQGEKHGKNKNGEVWFETQEKFENIPSFYLTWLGLVWQIQFSSIHGDRMQLWIKKNRSSTLFLMQLFWDILRCSNWKLLKNTFKTF